MVFAVACTVSLAVTAVEKTVTVAAGETIGLAEALTAAGLTLENNDTLVKTGGGRLVGSTDYSGITIHLRIVEGVFEGQAKDQFFKSGNIAVRNGATLDVNNTGGGLDDCAVCRRQVTARQACWRNAPAGPLIPIHAQLTAGVSPMAVGL